MVDFGAYVSVLERTFLFTSFRCTPFSLSEFLVEEVSRSVLLTAFQMEVLSARLLLYLRCALRIGVLCAIFAHRRNMALF
jgi:hypothetical protein